MIVLAGKFKRRGSAAEIAELLMITARRVNQLAEQEILRREPEGDFVLPVAIAAYYEYKFEVKEEADYLGEKAKHEAAKRQLAELELAKARREVHAAGDVRMVMVDMLTNLRSQLLALPNKLAPVLAGRDERYIANQLAREIASRLEELSDYKPGMFDGARHAAEDN